MKNTIEEIKQTIVERLSDYKGTTTHGADLAYKLFEGENVNGSVLCNTYKTKEFIKENFELFGELVEHVEQNMDMVLNPFAEPEKAHVFLLLEASQSILSTCPTIDKHWNEQIELTDKFIKKLTKEIKAFDGDLF
jgi:hypothetical protein